MRKETVWGEIVAGRWSRMVNGRVAKRGWMVSRNGAREERSCEGDGDKGMNRKTEQAFS